MHTLSFLSGLNGEQFLVASVIIGFFYLDELYTLLSQKTIIKNINSDLFVNDVGRCL